MPAPDRAAADRPKGLPLKAKDGRPVDDLGRYIDAIGTPVDEDGSVLTDADGTPLLEGHAHPVCDTAAAEYDFKPHIDGAWYRCCGGRVRKLVDCCGYVTQPRQRRQGADGLLLPRPQGVLRHVLRHEGQMLSAIVVAAALVAGVTGAWSPCGFSMVETLAPAGYAGSFRTTAIACTTFAAGALVGGVITFGGLALIGRKLGAQAPFVAAAVALIAALGEARGTRIVPQVRRQVPESWRRVMPVPLAAGLYGVLLGLGFTTFILSFAVWALAGISVALGDPPIGLLIGLGFGAGRAIPVIALAPSGGGRLHAAMAERPRILRSLRAVDALALAVTAAALAAAPAQAAVKVIAAGYADPSFDGPRLRAAPPRRPRRAAQPRGHAAAAREPPGGRRRPRRLDRGRERRRPGAAAIPAPGADAVAVSANWVAWRAGQTLYAASLDPAQGFVAAPVHRRRRQARAERQPARVRARRPDRGPRPRHRPADAAAPREARGAARPSVLGYRLTYIRATYKRQQVLTGVARPAQGLERPHALRHDPHSPTRRRPREGPLPRQGPHQQAALGPPAGGRPRHADDDRERRHAPST